VITVICINIVFSASIFFTSSMLAGLTYKALKVLSGNFFDLYFIMILCFCLVQFYVVFLLLMILYYKLILRIISEKECVFSIDTVKGATKKQVLRVFVDAIIAGLASPLISFFPCMLRLLGAKVGKDPIIKGKILNPDIIAIGDNVIIGVDALIIAHVVEGTYTSLKKIRIGNRCTIGVRSFVMPGVEIGDNSIVASGAVVVKNTKIPPNEIWGGIPAKKIGEINEAKLKNV